MLALLDRYWPAGGVTPLTITGVHFHLDGYAAADRVTALTESLGVVEALRERGHHPAFVDIGGGIPMSYLDDAGAVGAVLERAPRRRCSAGASRSRSSGHGLGLIAHGGEIIGRPNVYPYFQAPTRGAWLAARPAGTEVTTRTGRADDRRGASARRGLRAALRARALARRRLRAHRRARRVPQAAPRRHLADRRSR